MFTIAGSHSKGVRSDRLTGIAVDDDRTLVTEALVTQSSLLQNSLLLESGRISGILPIGLAPPVYLKNSS